MRSILTVAAEIKSVVDFQAAWAELDLPAHVREVLAAAPLMQVPENRPQLLDWALGRPRARRIGGSAIAKITGSTKPSSMCRASLTGRAASWKPW